MEYENLLPLLQAPTALFYTSLIKSTPSNPISLNSFSILSSALLLGLSRGVHFEAWRRIFALKHMYLVSTCFRWMIPCQYTVASLLQETTWLEQTTTSTTSSAFIFEWFQILHSHTQSTKHTSIMMRLRPLRRNWTEGHVFRCIQHMFSWTCPQSHVYILFLCIGIIFIAPGKFLAPLNIFPFWLFHDTFSVSSLYSVGW
jgi:hypothetical protein